MNFLLITKIFIKGCAICVNLGLCDHAGRIVGGIGPGPHTVASQCDCEDLCNSEPLCNFWDYGFLQPNDCYLFATCLPYTPYNLSGVPAVNGPNGAICPTTTTITTTTLTAITTTTTSTTSILGSIVSTISQPYMNMGGTGIIRPYSGAELSNFLPILIL